MLYEYKLVSRTNYGLRPLLSALRLTFLRLWAFLSRVMLMKISISFSDPRHQTKGPHGLEITNVISV